jgi:hypothetical protein
MIADIFSGLALTVERPFTIGDWLEIGSGLAGKIIEANWVRRDPVAPGARWRCRSVLEFIYKASIIIGQPVLLQN